jgi:hypothetical protein
LKKEKGREREDTWKREEDWRAEGEEKRKDN